MKRVALALATVTALGLAACTGDDPGDAASASPSPSTSPTASADPTPSASPTPTAQPVAIDEIPPLDQIDAAYVQRVLQAFAQLEAQIADSIAESGEFGEDPIILTQAFNRPAQESRYRSLWVELLLPAVVDDPGIPTVEVTELATVREDGELCVSAVAAWNYDPVAPGVLPPDGEYWVAIQPADPDDAAAQQFNDTAWEIGAASFRVEATSDPCATTEDDA